MQKGVEKGKVEPFKAMLFDLVEIKFGAIDPGLAGRIQAIGDLDTLERIRHAVKKADSLKTLVKAFKN